MQTSASIRKDLDPETCASPAPVRSTAGQRLARRLLHARLERLGSAKVELTEEWSGERSVIGSGSEAVCITVTDPGFYTKLVRGGAIGAAEAWMDGLWRADDLVALVRVLVREREVLSSLDGGIALLSAPLRRLGHALRRNSRSGSRYNIAAHYDLGNDFFRLFLDQTLTYSCALFERPESTLRAAQVAKLDRLCRSLRLSERDHLLEIGTGWGSMALHAASRYGCRVTTTTISREQHDLATERIAEAGLEDRVSVLLEDYRDLRGTYDKLVSVEMVEAVGHHYLDTFFRRCDELLVAGGRMAMQAITIADRHYAAALKRVDFIKEYIFPGSFIPSVTALAGSATRASSLRLRSLEDFGPHYARTLWHWRHNLLANSSELRELGYDDAFLRMWEFYLAYCEGGFAERYLGLVQTLWER